MPLPRQTMDSSSEDKKVSSQVAGSYSVNLPRQWQEIKSVLGNQVSIYSAPSWNCTSESYSLQSFLIQGEIVLFSVSGHVRYNETSQVKQCMQRVIQDSGKKRLYHILDLAQAQSFSMAARKEYEKINQELQPYWIQSYYILSPLIKTIYKIYTAFKPGKLKNTTLTDHISQALNLYQSHKSGTTTPSASSLPDLQELSKEELITQYQQLHERYEQSQWQNREKTNKILEIIGKITWDGDFQPQKIATDPDDPFFDVFSALNVLQLDIYEILKELKDLNQNLEKQIAKRTLQLTENENKLSLIIESTSNLILSVDRHFQVLVLNNACKRHFYQVYGKPLEVDQNLKDYWAAEEQAYWFPKFEQTLQGHAVKFIHVQPVQDKSVVLEVNVNPIRGGEGQVAGISIFCKDITEQHLAEQAVKESEKSLSNAHRIAKSGSWEYCIHSQKIVVSKEALTLLGIPDQEKMVMSLSSFLDRFVYPDDVPLLRNKIELAQEHTNDPDFQDQFEYRLYRTDGKLLHLMLHSRFKTNERGIIYGVTQDITDQKETEEQLRKQNEELVKVNHELDRFVYSVSHDLRAPLTSILGLINIARTEEDRDNIMTYLDLQERSVLKLDYFIREIIDLSKNARLPAQKQSICFQELIEEIWEGQTYDPDTAYITKEITVNQPIAFQSDKSRIGVILNNLISNSIRYANPQQPHQYIKIKAEVSLKEAVITVEDNGIGIHSQHVDKVFDMFYRASETKTGSGLGLYIVKETVNKMNGFVQVQSRVGSGTTFTVTLPNLLSEV